MTAAFNPPNMREQPTPSRNENVPWTVFRELLAIPKDPPEYQKRVMQEVHAADRKAEEQVRQDMPSGLTPEKVQKIWNLYRQIMASPRRSSVEQEPPSLWKGLVKRMNSIYKEICG